MVASAPYTVTPIFSKASDLRRASPPPNTKIAPSGRSVAATLTTSSSVIGSTYNLSAAEKSVVLAAGLLLSITVSYPKSFKVCNA